MSQSISHTFLDHEIAQLFVHDPTAQQMLLMEQFIKFLKTEDDMPVFVLRGYAGTGKTTAVSAMVKLLPKLNLKSVLLAPTGRAAKVMANYSGKPASTIHKKIYRRKIASDHSMSFDLAVNNNTQTVFIVDEASMIADQSEGLGFSSKGLLSDLLDYIFNNKRGCKLVLVGDQAQLPPVGLDQSPALDVELLKGHYGLDVYGTELTEVMRQQQDSGILFNATQLRSAIEEEGWPKLFTRGFKDCYKIGGEKLGDGLNYAYNKFGIENTLVICRSNKSANEFNRQVRNRILYREEEITGGDYVMIVRNNYFWLPETSEIGFIANGDIARVRKVRNEEEQYGFRFINASLELIDYPNEPAIECKLLLDTLTSESPSLSSELSKQFYETVLQDYIHIKSKKERYDEMKKNPYFNALQIKFAYAVTCHKAQGGQWDAVFVEQGFLKEDMVNKDFKRWLYTATTRASKELYLLNFSEQFFSP